MILAWCRVLDMADLIPFMCSERSSAGFSRLAEKMFENEMLVSMGEYWLSNDLRVAEL